MHEPDNLLPVVEVFGPTVQGEGALAGLPTHFVRFGYCDFRCEWCDSMYAVDPEEVSKNAERLSETDVLNRVRALPQGPTWVTLSGGNPAIHDLGPLEVALHEFDFKIAVETQGSYWREWLADVDHLTVSPKPPSSGMATPARLGSVYDFIETAELSSLPSDNRSFKVVVFDEDDLAFARGFADRGWRTFLSVGTDRPDAGEPLEVTRAKLCDRLLWLYEAVSGDDVLSEVQVFPQLHVLAWGHARAV